MEKNFTQLIPSLITILANANFKINLDMLKETIKNKVLKNTIQVKLNDVFEKGDIRQFKGQISVIMSFGNVTLNVMIFSVGTIKITGCKYMRDAIDSLYYLWVHYLQDTENLIIQLDRKPYEFILKCEMINYCVPIVGFQVDKTKINTLLNQKNIFSFYDSSYDNGVGVVFTPASPVRHLVKLTVKQKNRFSVSIIPSTIQFDDKNSLKIHTKTKLAIYPTKVNICGSCVDFDILRDHYNIFQKILNDYKIVISTDENN